MELKRNPGFTEFTEKTPSYFKPSNKKKKKSILIGQINLAEKDFAYMHIFKHILYTGNQ